MVNSVRGAPRELVQQRLQALNSLTKYPSMPTYHTLDPANGNLLEEPVAFDGEVVVTEKVDGTNARIILTPIGQYVLGSREELLYAEGDLIGNPAQGIVQHLRPVAEAVESDAGGDEIVVLYLELYGGKIGAGAQQYSTRGAVGWRLFDAARIDGAKEKLTWPRERIAAWRDNGGQQFASEEELLMTTLTGPLPLVPRLAVTPADLLPTTVEGTLGWLKTLLPVTEVKLDDSGKGFAEGVVLRTGDRSQIAKARFADYRRTISRRSRKG